MYVDCFFFSSGRRHTSCGRDWSSDVCSSDLARRGVDQRIGEHERFGECERERQLELHEEFIVTAPKDALRDHHEERLSSATLSGVKRLVAPAHPGAWIG